MLIEKIDKALEISRIMKDVECFSYSDRYTGSEDGEKAAERIAKRMEELGIPAERVEIYQVYRSSSGRSIHTDPRGFFGSNRASDSYVLYVEHAENLEAELVLDRISATGEAAAVEAELESKNGRTRRKDRSDI
ncbi:MAG: hypothetical protein ACLR78_03855 [Roseburia sp.]